MSEPEKKSPLIGGRYEAAWIALFVCAWPIFAFIQENLDEGLESGRIVVYFPILLVVFFATAYTIHFATGRRDFVRSAYLAGLSGGYMFFFEDLKAPILDLLAVFGFGRGIMAVYALSVLLLWAAGWRLLRFKAARVWMFALAGVALLLSVVGSGQQLYVVVSGLHAAIPEVADKEPAKLGKRNNIYFIVTDMYARQDTLKKHFGLDNEPFLEALTEKGFFVPRKSYANFPITGPSVATMFQMDYISTPENLVRMGKYDLRYIIRGDSNFVRTVKGYGYSYIYLNNGFMDLTRCTDAVDQCIAVEGLVHRQDMIFWEQTPLPVLVGLAFPKVYRPEMQTAVNMAGLDEMMAQFPFRARKPYFLYAHIEAPHPPFLYEEGCRYRPEGMAEKWRDLVKDKDNLKRLYRLMIKCTNPKILAFIDKIYQHDDDPIIIITGDHGTATQDQYIHDGGPNINTLEQLAAWTENQREERMAIFQAYRLPERCRNMVYDTITPVNALRVALSCIEEKPRKLLKDRIFLCLYDRANYDWYINPIEWVPSMLKKK